jgi:hypothetical protein
VAIDDDGEPRLPVKFGPVSNGEFYPRPHTPVVREAIRRAHAMADDRARRLGMSRRRFLTTMSGAAVTWFALSACSNESNKASGNGSGGSLSIPPESTIDQDAAADALSGNEFIMDVQTHLLDADLSQPAEAGFLGSAFPFARCEAGQEAGDPRACFTLDSYLNEMFLRSDTSVTVLSALPIPGEANPLSLAVMEETRKTVERLCGDGRVLMHGGAYPHVGPIEPALEAMTEARDRYDIAAWKIYTMVPGNAAFFFDDHDPTKLQIGQTFIDHVREIGPPIICTHKGISSIVGSTPELCTPVDIGPAAARNPDIDFVVYHSGYEPTQEEGPYTPETRHLGTNRLIASLEDAGIGPNENVYAELGGTWWFAMQDPAGEAPHILGKLLKYVGEDNVVWGTDSIWFGTPQDQIQALRTFEISEEFQERYGYPALTPEIKAKIFGGNSARLYGVDPEAVPCEFTPEELEAARASMPPPRTYGPETAEQAAKLISAHQNLLV